MAFISKMTRGQTEICCKIFKMLLPSLNSCSFSFLEKPIQNKDKKGTMSEGVGVTAVTQLGSQCRGCRGRACTQWRSTTGVREQLGTQKAPVTVEVCHCRAT